MKKTVIKQKPKPEITYTALVHPPTPPRSKKGVVIVTSDLDNIKALVDTYDKVYSGFANDLEDIQKIIFLLTNYDGTDLGSFLSDIKKYKTVKMQSSGADDRSGLETLTIDILVEARRLFFIKVATSLW